MLSYEDALARILAKARPLPAETVPLEQAWSRVCAETVTAPFPLPPFANSAMDGFAVRVADLSAQTSLPVVGEVKAGATELPALPSLSALLIFTGAPLPPGADTVVPLEDVIETAGAITVTEAVTLAQFVRAAGSDIGTGETVIAPGMQLRAAEIAMLAAVGRVDVQVYRRPTVAVISTGDELIAPGEPLKPGQIYNSNAFALAAQVQDAGGTAQQIHAADTKEVLRDAFDASAGADVILSSGGVSVGAYDYVKPVFEERGALDFWRVAIRPGKPLAFGIWGDTLFFGLPGNPVSSQVTFELFVRPALLQLQGVSDILRPTVQARLTEEVSHEPGRRSYQRGFVTLRGDGYEARPTGAQGSHRLRSLLDANALLVVPSEVSHIAAGETVTAILTE